MTTKDVVRIDPIALLREHQDERCAVCGEQRSPLLIDHDHKTNLIRGLLCNGCNSREGHDFRAPWFEKYREYPPAERLGLRVDYRHRFALELEIEPLIEELAALVQAAGWQIGTLGWAKDDAAVNIVDPSFGSVVECISLWGAGPHEGRFTWGDTHQKDDRGAVLNTAYSLPASTPPEVVANTVTWMLQVESDADRLRQLLKRRYEVDQCGEDPVFSIDRGVATFGFDIPLDDGRSDEDERVATGHLRRVVTGDTDVYFWSAPFHADTLVVQGGLGLEQVAEWSFRMAEAWTDWSIRDR